MKGPLRYRNRNNGKRGKWENPRVTPMMLTRNKRVSKRMGEWETTIILIITYDALITLSLSMASGADSCHLYLCLSPVVTLLLTNINEREPREHDQSRYNSG